jgi:hypothetical protein
LLHVFPSEKRLGQKQKGLSKPRGMWFGEDLLTLLVEGGCCCLKRLFVCCIVCCVMLHLINNSKLRLRDNWVSGDVVVKQKWEGPCQDVLQTARIGEVAAQCSLVVNGKYCSKLF